MDSGQWSVRSEPSQKAALEFFRGRAKGAAVVGGWDFPELSARIAGVDTAGMADGDVAVDLAVDEEDWDGGRGYGIFGRDFLHVEVVLPAGAEEGDFNQRTQEGASDPGAKVEGLSHAVVGDLAKIGEGRFGGHGAEVGMGIKRLEELCGSHRFRETEDAAGMILRLQKVEPLVDIIFLEEAVGG